MEEAAPKSHQRVCQFTYLSTMSAQTLPKIAVEGKGLFAYPQFFLFICFE